MQYLYRCSNPRCPRCGQEQVRAEDPEQYFRKYGEQPVRCLSCGWSVDYLGAKEAA